MLEPKEYAVTRKQAKSKVSKRGSKGKVAVKKKKKVGVKKTSAKKARVKKAATKKTTKKKVVKKARKKIAAPKKVKKKVAVKKAKKAKKAKKVATRKRSTPKSKKATRPAPKRAAKKAREERQAITSPDDKPVKRRSSGLSPKDLAQFRELLLDKRGQLLGDVTALQDQAFGSSEQAGGESRMPLHMADLGSDNFEHEFTLGLIEGEQAVLKEIQEALERVENGTFGICLATGKPIGKARLRAKPWAKYCYEYTLAQEKGRGRGL